MEIYIKLFEVLFPVFFIVGIGYYLGKKNPKIDTTFISNFAANIGSPAIVIYSCNAANISFDTFSSYFWYYLIAISGFFLVGISFLYIQKTKDIIRELPPFIMPNTGNMGLPICLFAYGTQGLGVAAAISALIILCHFTLGVFLADRKFNLDVISKSPAFYSVIIAVGLLYFNIELPVLQTHFLKPGEGIGYGLTYVCKEKKKVATLAGGYADGLTRNFSNVGFLYHNKIPCPILGKVSMDLVTVDISHLNQEPTKLTFVGQNQSINDLSDIVKTISHEILINFGNRFSRQYVN